MKTPNSQLARRESAASCQECRVAAPASLAWKIGSSGAWLTMKRRPGFTRRAVNDHFSTSPASTAAPNGCRRSIAPPANPIYLCACHAAQGRARPGTPGMTLGTGCADLCSSRRIRELPSPTNSGCEASKAHRRRSLGLSGPTSHPCDRGLDLTGWFTSFGRVMSEARCDAGSARRQLEKRPAGVPQREPSPEGRFSARRPRHRASDMTLLNVPLITHRPTPNAQGPTRNPQRCQVERLEVAS